MEFPVTANNQEEFDELVKGRLEKVREEGAREAESRAEAVEARARDRIARRDAVAKLKEMGVEAGRQARITRQIDWDKVGFDDDGEPNQKDLEREIKAVHKDVPELFGEANVREGAADASQGSPPSGEGAPITSEEQIGAMSHDEINSDWEGASSRIRAFLTGKR